MKVLLAKKSQMTQYFDEDMSASAVTVLALGEITVVEVKTTEKNGYNAIVVGYGTQKEHRINKAQVGYTKDIGLFKTLKEFRFADDADMATFSKGQVLGVEQFAKGDTVTITGTSKGKGFQGVVKRHGFKGKGPIHNVHHALREPGSIGGGGRAGGRVVKGMKMAGRMGGDRITVKNLKIIAVDPSTKTILVKGAVPGNNFGVVEVVSNK